MAKAEAGTKKPGRPKAAGAEVVVAESPAASSPPVATSGAMLGFETKLWRAADEVTVGLGER